MTNILGIAAMALALVPAPKEQVWREGTCAYVEADVRHVRDAALPPEGYRLDIASPLLLTTNFPLLKTTRHGLMSGLRKRV